jgi:hypothetical protein
MDRDFIFFFVGLLVGYGIGTLVLVLINKARRES